MTRNIAEIQTVLTPVFHDYEGVNLRLVWEIISEDIPELWDKTEFLFEEE